MTGLCLAFSSVGFGFDHAGGSRCCRLWVGAEPGAVPSIVVLHHVPGTQGCVSFLPAGPQPQDRPPEAVTLSRACAREGAAKPSTSDRKAA